MIDPLSPMRVVAINDPALDVDSMGDSLAEYARTRDEKLLKLKLGQEPKWFTVRGMTVSYLLDVVYTARSVKTQNALAFLACIHEIELPGGRKVVPEKIETGAYKQSVASEDWLTRAVRTVGMDALQDIGRVAVRRAELPEDERGPFV